MSPNHGGPLKDPTLVVLRYSGTADFESARNSLYQKNRKTSVHFLVGRDGKCEVVVPTNLVAWHASGGVWQGRPHVNSYALGVGLVNAGPILPDRTAVATGERLEDRDVYEGKHMLPSCSFELWQRYPEPQIAALNELLERLRVEFPSLAGLVDLSDVAAHRDKLAVGPALQFSFASGSRKMSAWASW